MIDLIAEIGWNHMGDMSLAKKMIDAATGSGATYAKFQTWRVSRLTNGPWDKDGRREIYEKAELSDDDHVELANYCEQSGIKFLTSCFSVEDLPFVRSVSSEVKIASMECRNWDLIQKSVELFDTVFMSVGTAEQKEWLVWTQYDKVRLMHCVSAYPCEAASVNLPKLREVLKHCPNGGYSGHYQGTEDAIAAICMGAQVVEKHFTINSHLPGRDNKFALMPLLFNDIKLFIDKFELMSKDHGVDYQPIEQEAREIYAGRWG